MKKTATLITALLIAASWLFMPLESVFATPLSRPLLGPPAIDPPGLVDQTGVEGTALTPYTFAQTDIFIDNDGDAYSLGSLEALLWDEGAYKLLPTWLTFAETPPGSDTYTFSGTPTQGSVGVYNIHVLAFDGPDSTYDAFTYTILDDNHAPTVVNPIPDVDLNDNETFSFSFPQDTFNDQDGDVLSYIARQSGGAALPYWLNFNQSTGTFSGTVPNGADNAVTVRVTAMDTSDASVYDDFVIDLTNINYAPALNTPISDKTTSEDAYFSYQFPDTTFLDIDEDTLTYSAVFIDDSPLTGSWLGFNPATRTFSGTPDNDDVGEWDVRLTASDGEESVSDEFKITVENVNDPPFVANAIPDRETDEDSLFTYTVPATTFDDIDDDTLTLSAERSDGSALATTGWLSFSGNTFTGTPDNSQVGSYTVRVTADDGHGGTVSDLFDITVNNVNDAPLAGVISNRVAYDNEVVSFGFGTTTFSDPDDDSLSYVATLDDDSALPAWLSFDGASRTFSGTVPNGASEVLTLKVTATDDGVPALSASTTFTLELIDSNDDPQVDQGIADRSTDEDALFSFAVPGDAFYDPDGDVLTYTATLSDDSDLSTSGWLSFDGSTFSGTPLNEHVGSYDIKVKAADGGGAATAAETTFTITVDNVNDAPQLVNPIAGRDAVEDSAFEFVVPSNTFEDVDDDAMTCSAQWKNYSEEWVAIGSTPTETLWVAFDTTNCKFSGTPDNNDVFPNNVWHLRVTASDIPAGASASAAFDITVANVNDAPEVTTIIADQSTTEETAFDIDISAALHFRDVDGDTLSYNAVNVPGDPALPAWFNFSSDGTTLNFSGTPPLNYADSFTVRLVADDGDLDTHDDFTFSVNNVNDSPLVDQTIPDQDTNEDAFYTYTLPADAFDDPDLPYDPQETLLYSVTQSDSSALPGWLSFNTGSLLLSGTPTNDNVGTLTLRVMAGDRLGSSVYQDFDLTVNNVNDDPQVDQGIPDQNTDEDVLFELDIPADAFHDDDGDTLTYTATLSDDSALSTTGWLSFDGTTFSGTPLNAHVGSYEVKVKAADGGGAATAAETAFTITVNNVNDAPFVNSAIPDQDTTEDSAFSYQFPSDTFDDVDTGTTLTYTAAFSDDSPLTGSWLSFDAATRTFSGTPENDDVGDWHVRVTASDSLEKVNDDFTISVANVNDAPVVTTALDDLSTIEETAFDLDVTAADHFNDIDAGDTLSYSAANVPDDPALPAWFTFTSDGTTLNLSGTPPLNYADSFTVRVTADDGQASVYDDFEFSVTNVNDNPVVDQTIPDQDTDEDVLYTYTLSADAFDDPDLPYDPQETLSYTVKQSDGSALPGWLSFDAGTRHLSGTPLNTDVATLTLRATITDRLGLSIYQDFDLTVNNVNDTPVVANEILNQNATEDTAFSYTIPANTFSDDDSIHGDSLSLTVTLADGSPIDLPAPEADPFWLDFDAAAGVLSGTPLNDDAVAGSYIIKVTAADTGAASVDEFFTINIANVNDAPTVLNGIANQHTDEDALYTFDIPADAFRDIDPDTTTDPETGDSWTYTAVEEGETSLPAWLSFSGTTFTGTPDNSQVGAYEIAVTIHDSASQTASTTFTLTVDNVNDTPVAGTLGSVPEADEDSPYTFTILQSMFDDDDIIHGDALTYTALSDDDSALPGWLSFSVEDANSRLIFSGMPLMAHIGSHDVKVIATDTQGADVEVPFTIVVNAVNDAPLVANAIPDRSTFEDNVFSYQVPANTFSDEEHNVLTWSAYQVLNPGLPGESAEDLPGWLTFNAVTRIFNGTPTNDDVGSLTLRVQVVDNGTPNESVYDDFVLTVINTNDAPTLDNPVADQSVDEDSSASFCIPADTFSDIDGDTLTYAVTEADETAPPAWITVDNSSPDCGGLPKLSFAPDNADVGTVYLKVAINDGHGGKNSDLFSVTAVNTNDDPYAANAIGDFSHDEDAALSFTFSTNVFGDDDLIHGDTLAYTALKVVNAGQPSETTVALPAWISLSGRTFSGTPDYADVEDLTIRLTASDDAGSSASTDFTIMLQLVNDEPQVVGAIPAQSATEDIAFSFDLDDVPYATFHWLDEEDDLAGLDLTLSADLDNDDALPGWLSFDGGTHVFSGTALNDDTNQTLAVRITATDAQGSSVTTTFDLEVVFVDDPPQHARNIPDKTATEDQIFSYQIPIASSTAIFTDEENSTLTYSAEPVGGGELPDWLTFTTASRLFSGTPGNDDVGAVEIKVTAEDALGRSVNDTFIITVQNSNDTPYVNQPIPDQSFSEDEAFSYTFPADTFMDVDVGDTLGYTAELVDGSSLPAWLAFDAGTRSFSVSEGAGVTGVYYVKVTAVDDGSPSLHEIDVFKLSVINVPDVITVANPINDQTTNEDSEYQYTLPSNTFLHGDGSPMTYKAQLIAVNGSPLDPFVTLTTGTSGTWLRARMDNVNTIYIYGTPYNSHVGTYTIRVTADDGLGNSNYDDYELEVININDWPYVSNAIGKQTATEDVAFTLDVSDMFADVDVGDSYTIETVSVSGIGSYPIDHVTPGETTIDLGGGDNFWLTYHADTLGFSGLPTNDDVYDSQGGSYTLTLTATDTHSASRTYSFGLSITPVNDAPVAGSAISNKSVTCGSDLYKVISDTAWVDVDEDDTFTYGVTIDGSSTLPAWLTFDAATRYFHGAPTSSNAPDACGAAIAEGTTTSYDMLVTVTDSGDESVTLDTFTFSIYKPYSGSGSLMYISTDDSQFGDLTIYEDCILPGGGIDPNCSFDLPVDAFQNYVRATTADPWVRDDSLLSYTVSTVAGGLPAWIAPDGDNGSDTSSPYADPLHLTFSPGDYDPDIYYLYFTASNSEGDFRDNVKKLTVLNTNDTPTVANALSDRSATEEYAFEYVFPEATFDDIDELDSLTYSVELVSNPGTPSESTSAFPVGFWLSFNPETRAFSGTPSNDDVTRNTVGSVIYNGDPVTVRVTATDEAGATASDDFNIVVNNNQDYPYVDSSVLSTFSSMTVQESDSTWDFTLPADVCKDVDQPYNDTLSYNTVELLNGDPLSASGWLTYDSGTRTFDGTPEYENVGNHYVRVYCRDLTGRTANFYFTVSVENVNDHPLVANPIDDTPMNAYEDTSFFYQAPEDTFSDEEDNDLIYSAYLISSGSQIALPDWLRFDSSTQLFSSEHTDTQDPPGNDEVGLYQIRMCVEEDLPVAENPGSACEDFYIRVNNTNDIPLVDSNYLLPDQTTDEDSPYSFRINSDPAHPTFYDIDVGDSLSFSATLADGSALPAWLTISGDTLSGTPANDDVDRYYIKAYATDGSGAQTSDIYILDVQNVNDAPTVANPTGDKSATEDQEFTFTVPLVNASGGMFADVDNAVNPAETHTFHACSGSNACACDGSSSLDAWLSLSGRILTATPNYTEQGSHDISITVCDAAGASAYDVFDLEVVLANDTPLVANPIPDQDTDEDLPYSFTFAADTFNDEEGETLTYTAVREGSSSLPAWLTFDAGTRTFTSIANRPDYMDIGSVNIVVRATDSSSEHAYIEDTFVLTVNPVNDTPQLNQAVPDRDVYEEALDSYQISYATFVDEEGDALTYSLSMDNGDPMPDWISFNAATRILQTEPQNDDSGQTFTMRLTVTDDGTPNRSNYTTFDINTHDVNDAPTVNDPVDDMEIIEDIETHFVVPDGSGSDPATFSEVDHGDSLTYNATLSNDSALPGWVQFVPLDREFIFSPTNDHVGASNAIMIKLTATDSHGASASDIFEVTVLNVNDAPIRDGAIALDDQDVDEDSAFSMTVDEDTFYDIDPGDSVTYSAALADDSPLSTTGWLSFNPATLTFSGTPLNAHVGLHTIKLIATDQSGAANDTSFDTFKITVNNTNDAPTVGDGIPDQNATEDIAFSFTFDEDAFADVDIPYGDALTYTAVEDGETTLPGWLSFDGATRSFSGTPTNDDTSTFTIEVTADDGDEDIATTFDIIVAPVNDAPHDLDLSANTIAENSAVGTTIGTLTASDVDDSSGFTYTLIDGALDNTSFTITGSSLRNAVVFNYEAKNAYSVDVRVADPDGLTYHEQFNISIQDVNETPVLSGESFNLDEGDTFNSINLLDNDSDPDPADTIQVSRATDDVDHGTLTLNADGSFTYTHDSSENFNDSFTYEVCDNGTPQLCNTDVVTITINPVNDTPLRNGGVALDDQTAYEDNAFSLAIAADTFTDAEDGSLDYSAVEDGQSGLPGWLGFNSGTRTFSGTPEQSDLGVYTIRLTAADDEGLNASATFDIDVVNTNDAPTIANAIPDRSATEDVAFSYIFPVNTFDDIDPGDSLDYSAVESGQSGLPGWVSFNPGTRTFSGTPGNDDVGTWHISVTATDQSNASVTDAFDITVSNVNDVPTVANAIPDQNTDEDVLFSYTFPANTFNDIDAGDSLTYSAVESGQSDLPDWLSFNPGTRTFSGTPGNDEVGTYHIIVTAEDTSHTTVDDIFNIVVGNVNDAPTVANAIPERSASEDAAFSYTFPVNTFNDIDVGDSLTYSAVESGQSAMPGWLSFNSGTRAFSGTPGNDDVGTWHISVTASDQSNAAVTDTFNITVSNVNDAPTIANAIPDQSASEDTAFSYTFPANTFNDIDVGDSLTYSAVESAHSGLPTWLAFDADTRTFSGTPGNTQVGTWHITVTAEDQATASVDDSFDIVVANANDAPYLVNAIPDRTATEDVAFSYQIANDAFNDIDVGDVLTYSAEQTGQGSLPAWLSFNSGTRTFSGTPGNEHVAVWPITVTVTDTSSASAGDSFNITVNNVNDTPTVDAGISDQVAYEDSEFSFYMPADAFADQDAGDSLSYAAVGDGTLAAWLHFDPATRRFYGTPLYTHVGTNTVHVTARDSSSASVTTTFDITVYPVNDPPVVHTPVETLVPLVDRRAVEDSAFSLDITVSAVFGDEDLDTLTLSATQTGGFPLPAWLSLSATANPDIYTFSGVPLNADVGTWNISLVADDGHGASTADTFAIEVINTNDAPTADDTTVSVYEKVNKTVTMGTTDVDPTGDTVTCSIESLPTGGEIYLTPDGVNPGAQITPFMLPAVVTDCKVIYNTQADFASDVSNYDHFTFSAHDGSVRSAFDGTVTVNVRNSNNAPTDITLDVNIIDENNSINQDIGILTAADFDIVETHTFTLVNGEGADDNTDFNLTTDGTLKAGTVFNYEADTEKSIRVRATDSEGASVSKTFTIHIRDVNELVESVTLSNNVVVEGMPAGQEIGYLDISDPDAGDSWTIDITHIDASLASSYSPVPFAITYQNDVPVLVSNMVFNASTKSQYVVTLDVTDSGGLTKTQAFTILVYRMGESMVIDDVVTTTISNQIVIDILGNDSLSLLEQMQGPNAAWLFHRILVPPAHGTAVIGSIVYTPNDGYVGTDRVIYIACDNSFYCDYGSVTINIERQADNVEEIVRSLPASGFAPHRVTQLDEKPAGIQAQKNGYKLSIPALDVEAPIVGVPLQDGDWDINWLGSSAGYLQGSAFPTTEGNTVITGHVWNADGSQGIFLGLEKLKYGDEILIMSGDLVYTYRVVEVRQHLKPSQVGEIFQHEEDDWLTLFTCQGYDEKVDDYHYRIMARARLVSID